jgi:hypothetical protein
LLYYQTTGLLIGRGPLQVLSIDFDFPKASDNRQFLKNSARENCGKERIFKEIL